MATDLFNMAKYECYVVFHEIIHAGIIGVVVVRESLCIAT